MAEPIICPVCGEANPADMEFCQNCQSRLLPLTGPLKGEDAPLHPGQAPTKKVTSELEPILPEWLREARKQARQSAQDEPPTKYPVEKNKPSRSLKCPTCWPDLPPRTRMKKMKMTKLPNG